MLRSPDPWQSDVLHWLVTRGEDTLCLCSRQSGKTEVNAAAAYLEAQLGGFVLILTPSDEQSKEFVERVAQFHRDLNLGPCTSDPTKHEFRFRNGGRLKALPNNEKTVRIYAKVTLLIIDEAARVPDQLFGAVTPMLMVSRNLGLIGRTGLLSTPFGKRGFFYKEWLEGKCKRFRVPWTKCPRITPADVEAERIRHGDLWVKQEYELEFLNVAGNNYFDSEAFEGMIDESVEILQSW